MWLLCSFDHLAVVSKVSYEKTGEIDAEILSWLRLLAPESLFRYCIMRCYQTLTLEFLIWHLYMRSKWKKKCLHSQLINKNTCGLHKSMCRVYAIYGILGQFYENENFTNIPPNILLQKTGTLTVSQEFRYLNISRGSSA